MVLEQEASHQERGAYRRGRALYDKGEYAEAEVQLQQATERRKRNLGKYHTDTLMSKYWLGCAIYRQLRYVEAEALLRQVADGEERTLGKNHEDTLASRFHLGGVLQEQGKYSEAETQLRQVTDGRGRTLGKNHEDTLTSKELLAHIFENQKKWGEAELQHHQVLDGQQRIYGSHSPETLYTRYLLGRALYKQKKYEEVKMQLQQITDEQEKILGKAKPYMLYTLHRLKFKADKLSSTPTEISIYKTAVGRLDSFFREEYRREPYTDSDIHEMSSLLGHTNPKWSKSPRTYIVLRTIGRLDLLQEIIEAGFSDFWFPVTEQCLPGCLNPTVVRSAFFAAQSLILTKSMDLEKGENGHHCHFKEGENLPLEPKRVLGTGGQGQVDVVLSTISYKEYARKRVYRSEVFRGPKKERMKQFVAEIQVLKRLKHTHIVEFVGSYTDRRYLGLLMSPVAEMDLDVYLKHCTASHYPELRTFFGCLATALEFLHVQGVRHKDIKPGNILINRGNILLADFGLSLDFRDMSGSTTTGIPTAMSRRYCSPEVAEHEPRNTMSDLWSLGVVFISMVTILKGRTLEDIDDFFGQHGSQQLYIRTNMAALPEFVAMLEKTGQPSDNVVFAWTQKMLIIEHKLRTTASSLVASIIESKGEGFCGICCWAPEEDFSDSTDE